MMERLTTDNPTGVVENMLNYARNENGKVILSYADAEENINLNEYLSRIAMEKGCKYTSKEIEEDACSECECEVAVLLEVATQAAELRTRLKQYEDLEEQGLLIRLSGGLSTDTISHIMDLCEKNNSFKEMVGKERQPMITWQLYNFLLNLSKEKFNL